MKKSLYKLIMTVFAAALMMMLMPAAVFADSGGYSTESFNVNVVTDENHVFHITEEITVDFDVSRHGIYRNLPEGGNQYEIKNVRVYGYEYETYSENSNLVIKIGSGDHYVYGEQKYKISYDIIGFKDQDDNADHLAIDLLPTGWGTSIESSKLSITFPKRISDIEIYSGQYKDEGDSGYFLTSQDGRSLTAVSRGELPKGVGYTIRADLPEGYWINPKDKAGALPAYYGILGVLGALMLGLWGLVGRDKAVIKPVEFYPPNEMDPLQVDYIANDKIDAKDIAAQFMYFANKGYLKVIAEGKKKFKLEELRKPDSSEKTHSKMLLRELFAYDKTVNLKKLPMGFGECVAKIENDVKASFGGNMRAFTKASVGGRLVGTAICAIIPIVAGFGYSYSSYKGLEFYIMFIILGLLIGLFSRNDVRNADSFAGKRKPVRFIINTIILLVLLTAETAVIVNEQLILAMVFLAAMVIALISTVFVRQRANNDLYGRVLGFRNFIKTAEYDRLKTLSDEDPDYYFNIMPYAFVFGMSTKWADKFADFKIPQPSWYDSGGAGYDPYFTTYMFHSWSHGINSSVGDYYKAIGADIAGDVGGSFGGGGGGFSGGGFGGGGGGSW